MRKGVYWCGDCNAPISSDICSCGNEAKFCANDLKPLFPKERLLFEHLLKIELPQNLFRNYNNVWLDGKPLFRFKVVKGQLSLIEDKRLSELNARVSEAIGDIDFKNRFIKVNRPLIREKEKESQEFIENTYKEHGSNRELYVSFSGGKDSAVTAYLVKKVLTGVKLLFSDTTLEFPETVQYVRDFSEKYNFNLSSHSPPRNFFELCNELGPPSRMMRWCCTALKASAINEFYNENKENILCYLGIRSIESKARSTYKRVHQNTKISRQVNAYPILDWLDFDVWVYLLSENILLNPVYEWGYRRIGCWTCPNHGPFDIFLTEYSHPQLWGKWKATLEKYAQDHGKSPSWITSGLWKSRKVKYRDRVAVTADEQKDDSKKCITYNFEKALDSKAIEFLKPFGDMFQKGDDFEIEGHDLKIQGTLHKNILVVNLLGDNGTNSRNYVEKQITKYLNCIRCGGCTGACPNGAIKVNGQFAIDEKLCASCLGCCGSKHLWKSCVAIHYKENRAVIKSEKLISQTIHSS